MTRPTRRTLSILLAVAMAIGALLVAPAGAGATTGYRRVRTQSIRVSSGGCSTNSWPPGHLAPPPSSAKTTGSRGPPVA